jgi:ParB family chromosome partitioning protein
MPKSNTVVEQIPTPLGSMIIEVQIRNLIPSPRNVRKSKPDKEADAELIAGIREVGLLQNLVVIQNGKPGIYEVVAGTRRLKALQALVKEGHYQATDMVSCQWLQDSANAEEISLIENTQRVRMHPADEFQACLKMHKQGNGTETIAAALGIPESTVKKRLKLAQVALEIIKAYRNDEIVLEEVMAFTVEDDHARQIEVFNNLKGVNQLNAWHIRNALRGETETSSTRLGRFVGEKAYTKAGGAVSTDLFKEVTYFEDRELLVQLAIAKLEKAAAKLEGWNWTEISIDQKDTSGMKRITPYKGPETLKLEAQETSITEKLGQLEDLEQELSEDDWNAKHREHYTRLEAQLDEIAEKIELSYDFNAEEMALAGCIVTIGHDGKPHIDAGLVRKSEESALRALQAPSSNAGSSSTSKGSDSRQSANERDDSPDLSQALNDDLTTYRLNIAKRFLAIGGEDVARDLLYYTLAMKTFKTHYYGSPLDINIRETHPAATLKKPDTGRALQELEAYRKQELRESWLYIVDATERFRAFTQLSLQEKQALMAYCVAQSLCGGLADSSYSAEAEVALATLDIPWHKYFQPTAENYLGRVSKDTLLQLGEQFFTPWHAEGADKRTKKQLAQDLEIILAGEDKTMSAEKRAEAIDWVPAGFKPL